MSLVATEQKDDWNGINFEGHVALRVLVTLAAERRGQRSKSMVAASAICYDHLGVYKQPTTAVAAKLHMHTKLAEYKSLLHHTKKQKQKQKIPEGVAHCVYAWSELPQRSQLHMFTDLYGSVVLHHVTAVDWSLTWLPGDAIELWFELECALHWAGLAVRCTF